MYNELPIAVEKHLEYLGVLRRLPEEYVLTGDSPSDTVESIEIEFDEFGEPNF
jgi:hypothetical protein